MAENGPVAIDGPHPFNEDDSTTLHEGAEVPACKNCGRAEVAEIHQEVP